MWFWREMENFLGLIWWEIMEMKGMWFYGVDFNLMRGKKRRRDLILKEKRKKEGRKREKKYESIAKPLI